MASLKVMKNRNSMSRIRGSMSPMKKLSFDVCEDDVLHPSSSDSGIRKRIDFGPSDESDLDPNAEDVVPIVYDEAPATPVKPKVAQEALVASTPKESTSKAAEPPLATPKNQGIKVSAPPALDRKSEGKDDVIASPPRTRSGRIYKKRSLSPNPNSPSTPRSSKRPLKAQQNINLKLNLLKTDLESSDKESKCFSPKPAKRQRVESSDEEALLKRKQELPELPSPGLKRPPPLKFGKRSVSRLSWTRFKAERMNDSSSTPLSRNKRDQQVLETSIHLHKEVSPPTNGLQQLRLFDASRNHLITSPQTAPRAKITFDHAGNGIRRASAPSDLKAGSGDGVLPGSKKRKQMTNINPFSPAFTMESLKKRKTDSSSHEEDADKTPTDPNATPVGNAPVRRFQESHHLTSGRRIRVSDINISRYLEEFVELDEIASGAFGRVCIVRHRLDGMVYAIKMTKDEIHGQTHEERVAMNEVFAHSALIKHKHVVRYYNSWVECGRIFIQNEFCEGGSLASKIDELRFISKRLSEAELKRILLHVAKGLQYIHSKALVHLDIKPENIFIALEHASASSSPSVIDLPMEEAPKTEPAKEEKTEATPKTPAVTPEVAAATLAPVVTPEAAEAPVTAVATPDDAPEASQKVIADAIPNAACACAKPDEEGTLADSDLSSTDSGNVSEALLSASMIHPMEEGVSYKIGDLGHVVSVDSNHHPEEGDCRYMAPELLMENVGRATLFKSDVFSLGLSMYEIASLVDLPKNSLENPMYEHYKAGLLPPIEGYSKEFNALIKSMVNPDPLVRPSVARLISLVSHRPSSKVKSRAQLFKELKEAKARLKELEQELEKSRSSSGRGQSAECQTPPKNEETPSGTESNTTSKSEGSAAKSSGEEAAGTRMTLRQRKTKPAEKPLPKATPKRKTSLRKKALMKDAAAAAANQR